MDFQKNFTVKGKWGYPETASEEWIFGELKYDMNKGISLVLEGSLFKDRKPFGFDLNIVTPAIVGETKEEYFTLLNLTGFEEGSPSWVTTTLEAEFLLKHKQWLVNPALEVTGINFSTDFFFYFFKQVLKSGHINWGNFERFEFTYDQKPSIDVADNGSLNAYFYFKHHYAYKPELSLDFDTSIHFNIAYKKAITLQTAVADMHFYKDFFLFFSTRKISFATANIITRGEKDEPVEIEFLCQDKSRPVNTTSYQSDVLLQYSEISDAFPLLFANWLGNVSYNTSGLSLYMQTRYIDFSSPVPAFLNMVFALETLHIQFLDRPVFSESELTLYKQRKKDAFKDLAPNMREKINQCLSHLGRLSFAERLQELIDLNGDLLNDFIYDKADFTRRVKRQRNFLAHDHSESTKSEIPDMFYLYFIAVLRVVFEYAYLSLLGLPGDSLAWMHKRKYTQNGLEIRKKGAAKELMNN